MLINDCTACRLIDGELWSPRTPRVIPRWAIARALSQIPRYMGNQMVKAPHYSVAAHSVLVMDLIASRLNKNPSADFLLPLWFGLMHDVCELYTGDRGGPSKKHAAAYVAYSLSENPLISMPGEELVAYICALSAQAEAAISQKIVGPYRPVGMSDVNMTDFWCSSEIIHQADKDACLWEGPRLFYGMDTDEAIEQEVSNFPFSNKHYHLWTPKDAEENFLQKWTALDTLINTESP